MPRNKNVNVSKSPFRDHRSRRDRSLETAEDCRSREEKVSDLTDLFIGDHHIDTDIIHAVLEECDWNVEDATEKLFEVFFTNSNSKPAQSKKKEPTGLANIAVSILMDKNSDSERDSKGPKTNFDFNLASVAGDINNNASAANQKENNNLRPKISANENLVQYNDSSIGSNSKPSTESKTLFECKSSQRDFYNKNSFGDMAVNMEHYKENSGPLARTSNFNVTKDDLITESTNNQRLPAAPVLKTRPRFDLSKVSMDATPSLNNIESNSFDDLKSTSVFYTDKSMDSLFSGGHSPSSVEWNKFYKQLNMQPVQTEKVYPELSVNELLVSPKDSDPPTSVSSMNRMKPFTPSHSENFNQSVRNRVNPKSGGKVDSNKVKSQITKSRSKDPFENSSSTDKDAQESKLVIAKESNTTELEEYSSSTNVLSPNALEFVPRVLDAKRPMTRKSPVKQSKSNSSSSKDNRSLPSEKTHMFKKGKDIAGDKKQPTVGRNYESLFSGPQVQIIDPMDPLGWQEIRSMAPSKTHKSDFKINTKLLLRNHKLNDGSVDAQRAKGNGDISDDKSVLVPPFSFNPTTTPSNKNKKAVRKKKDKIPKCDNSDHSTAWPKMNKDSINAGLSDAGHRQNGPFAQDFSHLSINSDHSLPSTTFNTSSLLLLPPSLRKKQTFDHPSNPPLPQRENSKNKAVNHIVPKGDTASEGNSVVNRVQFVGVKTPVGKLKHYIDKKQPVMFILRGLPGSGKSYLAGQLVSECQRLNLQAANLSSDSFFTSSGQYNFNFEQLSEAHIWNKQRAQESLKNKQPVVIIDNTNTTMWEMLPYAELAILNGYDIQVCEPDTQWKTKVPELARKNQHGVTKDHIKRMKDRYENVSTDDVIREAAKSLKKKNKLPSNCNTTIDRPVKSHQLVSEDKHQTPTHHQLIKNFENPVISNPNSLTDKHTSSSSNQALTQWIPAMEQRDTTRQSKKPGPVQKQSSVHEITLDFLNNSIKKALVGIETMQESDRVDHRHSKMENPESETFEESNRSVNQGGIVGGEKKDTDVSEIKIERFVDFNEEIRSMETEDKELSTTVPVDTTECALDASNSLLPTLKLDNSGGTSELYYSCGSQDGDDPKEQLLNDRKSEEDEDSFDDGTIEKKSQLIIPKNLEKSISSHSCAETLASSDKESVVVEEDYSSHFDASIGLGDSGEKGSHSLDVQPDRHRLVSSVQIAKLECEVIESSDLEVNEKSDGSVEDKFLPVDVSLPPKQSLVVYSDSENEETDKDFDEDELNQDEDPPVKSPCSTSHVENIKSDPLVCETLEVNSGHEFASEGDKSEEEQSNSASSEIGLDIVVSVVDKEENENGEASTDKEESLIDGLTSKPSEDSNEATSSQSNLDSSESSSPTREQSPATNYDIDTSYIKKKKKKKVKPVENPLAPFLEESLIEKSKTENWSKFFFNETQSVERQSPPTRTDPQATMSDVCCQCEPYYFSMVYRLNSQAFSNQQPIDISNLDVVVIQASIGLSWADRFCSDVVVQRKSETTDRSTITDEMVDSEKVDLEMLQNCFPEYSRKQLEEVMTVCHNDIEWVSNNLMDAPPIIVYSEVEDEEDGDEKKNELVVKNVNSQMGENAGRVKSLAQLCREVVQSNQVLDSDDFEQQVIDASQTRLEEIEMFAWDRLRSSSFDYSHVPGMKGADIWPDDFNLGSFSGGYGLDDFGHDPVKSFKPIHVLPEFSMTEDSSLSDADNFEKSKKPLYHPSYQTIKSVTPTVPVLPVEFIKCLEMNYGSLNADLDESGLALDDSTARKIYNSLKLLMSKKRVQVGSNHEKQMREDEAMARALQEAEDAGGHDFASHKPSVQGWMSQGPSWMSKSTSPQSSVTENKRNSRVGPARLNSVSETLHNIRGAWPKRLKPFKFHSHMHRQQDYTVWTNKSSSRPRVADMHSIMEEEKASQAKLRRILVTHQASGGMDDLATKIKRSKLSQMFPSLSPDVLEEIFMNNGYSLETTVKCLESEYDHEPVHVSAEQEEAEVNRIIQQNGKAASSNESYQYQYQDLDDLSYEDLRKEAQFYDKLANECRQKAHRHHGEGMHHVAFFYRQEVKKYLAEKDDANQRAARLLFNKGSERLLRENTLDLHSYHINEAIEAVNLALEIKKNECRNPSDRKRRYLTIITGRGRNSKWGIPKLKPAIIGHLNNKNIRFEETAPGMFKVHLFQE